MHKVFFTMFPQVERRHCRAVRGIRLVAAGLV
jgi:hypothetical protein